MGVLQTHVGSGSGLANSNKGKQKEDSHWAKDREKHLSPEKWWCQNLTLGKHLSIISVTMKKNALKKKLKKERVYSAYSYKLQFLIDHKYRQQLEVSHVIPTAKRDNDRHVVCLHACAQLYWPTLTQFRSKPSYEIVLPLVGWVFSYQLRQPSSRQSLIESLFPSGSSCIKLTIKNDHHRKAAL